jgi:hypothetical protein
MKKTYSEKLQDPRWQKKRLEVFNRDEFTCQLCTDKKTMLHVHHKSYKPQSEPWEYELDNFQTLCESCHYVIEEFKKEDYLTFIKGFKRGDVNSRHWLFIHAWDEKRKIDMVEMFVVEHGEVDFLMVLPRQILNDLMSLIGNAET